MKTKFSSVVVIWVFAMSSLSFAASVSDEVPCAMMLKFGHGVQVIPPLGQVQTRFVADQPVVCGSMLITHDQPVWIRFQDQTVVKIGQNSFFELAKKKADSHRLYRGQALLSAPPSVSAMRINTPNSEIEFQGGVTWLDYSPENRETTVASFNRSVDFSNKFKTEAVQTVRVGEISRLSLSQERVVPTQPVVMSVSSVKEALQGFGLLDEEREELTQVVQRVFEGRAKSLTADIEQWNDLAKEEEVKRSIASVAEKATKKTVKAIDPEEARFSMELLKKHLYGDDEDLKMLNEPTRKPAAIQKLDDSQYEAKKKKKKAETQRLIDEVSKIQ